MMIRHIIGSSCQWPCLGTIDLGFLELGDSGSTFRNVSTFRDVIEPLLLDIQFVFWTRILYMKVPGLATVCPCGVWCHGLTTYLLFVSPFFGSIVLNNSNVSLAKRKRFCHCLFYTLSIYIYIIIYKKTIGLYFYLPYFYASNSP